MEVAGVSILERLVERDTFFSPLRANITRPGEGRICDIKNKRILNLGKIDGLGFRRSLLVYFLKEAMVVREESVILCSRSSFCLERFFDAWELERAGWD